MPVKCEEYFDYTESGEIDVFILSLWNENHYYKYLMHLKIFNNDFHWMLKMMKGSKKSFVFKINKKLFFKIKLHFI